MASSNEVIDRVPRVLSADPSTALGAATKQYVDNGLAPKANTSSLATVATSGSYNDLSNKPTIPTTLPPDGAAGGDLGSTYPNPSVLKVNGVAVSAANATALQTMSINAGYCYTSSSFWAPYVRCDGEGLFGGIVNSTAAGNSSNPSTAAFVGTGSNGGGFGLSNNSVGALIYETSNGGSPASAILHLATGTATSVSDVMTLTTGAVNVPALNVSGTTSHSAGTNYGSTVASSTSDLSRHIALWGATYGFCVTGSSLNYNSGGAHNFWQAVTVNSTLNVTGASTLTGAVTAPGGLTVSGCVMNGTDGWFRSSGQAGWFNSTYSGGWYMIDATYVRSYSNKAIVASDFVISSDRKLKTNIQDLKPRPALRPRTFTIIATGQESAGFVAQELEADCPEAVHDTIDEDGVTITKHVSPMPIIAVLSAQINALEEQVRLLQGKPKKTIWKWLKGWFV